MRPARALRRLIAALTLLAVVASAGTSARANTLVADLSNHLIAITTAFAGTDVVLFGTSDGTSDIVVTVIGPRQNQVVRRKSRVAGIWVNRDQLMFARVPAYYAVATTRPLAAIARQEVLARLELGTDHLNLTPVDAADLELSQVIAFRQALIRRKQAQRLYSDEPGRVTFVGANLFRTTLHFPANVPPGIYQVQVLELHKGFATGAQRSSLVIGKIGIEADIFDFAQARAPLYGLTAIVLAVASGWLAGVVFRRG